MARISKLHDIGPEVVSELKANKVTTVDELWQMIGPNFETGIQRVTEITGVSKDQLYEILKQQVVPYNKSFIPRMRHHWLEVLALIIIGVLLTVLIRNSIQRQDTLVINAPNGLPAFHIIASGEVRSEKRFGRYDSFTGESEVIGSYLLQPVSHNAVLRKSQLASPALKEQLTGRQVLTIPVKSSAITPTIEPASRVRLLFSPRTPAEYKTSTTPDLSHIIANFIIDDVIVLSIQRQGDSSSITVAFKNEEDRKKALALLTTSEILISA